jgi:hypothetical protein
MLILQGSFMAKIMAHESEASNLLKLNCKINDKLVGCLLDLGVTNSFMILQAAKATWSQNPINGRPHHGAIGTRRS